MMDWLHALIAVLAAFRLTTLFTVDALWAPIRRRFRRVPWQCSLCMSVWAGAAATLCYATIPWLNWPLALSWFYLVYMESRKPMTEAVKPQESVVPSDMQVRTEALQREHNEHLNAVSNRAAALASELAATQMRLGAAEAKLLKEAPPAPK